MYEVALLLHLLLLTYWLGADLGVFYSSRWVLKPDIPVAARTVALKIMSFLDLAPRVCLVLFLPSGISLMATRPHGATFLSGPLVAAAWVGCLAWMALTLVASTRSHDALGVLSRRLDLAVRSTLVVVLIGFGTYTMVATRPFGVDTNPRWLGGKVVLYAVAIACGIAIRLRLRPFEPAYVRLVREGPSPEVERSLRQSIQGSIPFVVTIWLCILGAATLGVVKPGATL